MTKRTEQLLNNVFREMYIKKFKDEISLDESLAIIHYQNNDNILAAILWSSARNISDLMYEIFDDRYTSVDQDTYHILERIVSEVAGI